MYVACRDTKKTVEYFFSVLSGNPNSMIGKTDLNTIFMTFNPNFYFRFVITVFKCIIQNIINDITEMKGGLPGYEQVPKEYSVQWYNDLRFGCY